MRESVSDSGYGHDDLSCMTYDIHVDILLGYVDIMTSHCMCILDWGSPCRKIQLLGIAHPVVGIIISGTEGTPGDGTDSCHSRLS